MFKGLIGNAHIKRYLEHAAKFKLIANSWLFSGIEGVGKNLFALEFAKILFCENDPKNLVLKKIESGNHPDIRHFRPKGKVGMHTIDSLRQFIEEVYYKPFEAPWKIFIIHEAHRMQEDAANALLKTLEEPAKDSIILLITNAKELILPTILSRCRTLHFQPIPEEEIAFHLMDVYHCPSDEARRYASLSYGSMGKAMNLFHKGVNPFREKILNFISKETSNSYLDLSEFTKEIMAYIEISKKEKEEELKERSFERKEPDSYTAIQKHELTKELEGSTSLYFLEEANSLFNIILEWFRDLHLLYFGGDGLLLIHKDYEYLMQRKILNSEPPSLEKVQKLINEARTSLQRSTPLGSCLENLFLKLNFVK